MAFKYFVFAKNPKEKYNLYLTQASLNVDTMLHNHFWKETLY